MKINAVLISFWILLKSDIKFTVVVILSIAMLVFTFCNLFFYEGDALLASSLKAILSALLVFFGLVATFMNKKEETNPNP